MEDRRRRLMGQFRPLRHRRRVTGLRNIVVSHVTSMVLVRCSSVKSAKRVSILVSLTKHHYILRDMYPPCLGACGIVDPGSIESWTCDLCQNEKIAEASLVRNYPVILVTCITNALSRTPNACSVLGPSASATEKHYTHLLIRFCVFANRLRVRAGYTSRVQCSYPR